MCGIWPSWRRREGWTVTPQSTKVRQTGRLSFSGCLCPACLQLCPTCASVFTRCATARRRLMKAWGAPSSRPAPTAPLVHSRAPVIRRPSRTSPTPPAAPVPCSSPCACFCSQAPPVPAVASPPPPLPPAPPQPPQVKVPAKPECVPIDSVIAEVFLGAAGSDGGMDIQEAQKADTDLGLIAEQGDPGCAWPRLQPTACFVGALPTKATQKLDPGAFGAFVRCRVVTPACARRLCK